MLELGMINSSLIVEYGFLLQSLPCESILAHNVRFIPFDAFMQIQSCLDFIIQGWAN